MVFPQEPKVEHHMKEQPPIVLPPETLGIDPIDVQVQAMRDNQASLSSGAISEHNDSMLSLSQIWNKHTPTQSPISRIEEYI